MIDAVFADIARKIRFRLVGISNDMCIGIGKQPYLRKGLVAIAENSDLPSLNPEERGKVERRSPEAEKSCSLCIGHLSRIAAQD